MEFSEILETRRSVKKFDPDHAITDEVLQELFGKVALTPTSFNLQHQRFVVVRDPKTKKKLRTASFNQEQIEMASAVIVVLGKLAAHEDAPRIYAEAPQPVQDQMIPMIDEFYAKNPQIQHDEAVRSASLAAMTLMYAAFEMGYATGPLIGFDPKAVGEIISWDAGHIPIMLIVLGKQTGSIRPRMGRLPMKETVKLETFNGGGLSGL